MVPEIADFETAKFIEMLFELALLSEEKIIPFNKCKEKQIIPSILYDDEKYDEYGYYVVLDYLIDEFHHDIISYYDGENYIVRAVKSEEDDNMYIEVIDTINDNLIVIENGTWYSV